MEPWGCPVLLARPLPTETGLALVVAGSSPDLLKSGLNRWIVLQLTEIYAGGWVLRLAPEPDTTR